MSLRDFWYSLRVARSVRPAARLAFLRGGLEGGLFEALRETRTASELAEELACPRDLIASWLRASHASGWLVCEGNAYAPTLFVRWLLETERGDAGRAMIEEVADAHAPLLRDFLNLARSGERPLWGGNEEAARRAARASRGIEGHALRALYRIPGLRKARRVLDIGCGDGAYLADFLERHRDALADGVELDAAAVERARARLRDREVNRRAEIHLGDFTVLDLPRAAYDLVLLNNNIYYFEEEARDPLFQRVFDHLAPGGALAIQSPMVGDDPLSRFFGATANTASFDAFLRIHQDLAGLPELDGLLAQLRNAGFGAVGCIPVVVGGSVRYVWAKKPKV